MFRTDGETIPIYIIVGGTVYATTKETLQAEKGSIFESMGEMPKIHHAPCGMPVPFIDRDGQLFGYILEYLRAVVRRNVDEFILTTDDTDTLLRLHEESKYYKLDRFGTLCRRQVFMPTRVKCWFEGNPQSDGLEHHLKRKYASRSSFFRWRLRNLWLLPTLEEQILSPMFTFHRRLMQFMIAPNQHHDNLCIRVKFVNKDLPPCMFDCTISIALDKKGELTSEKIMSFSNYKCFDAKQKTRTENFLPVEWSMFPTHYKNIVVDDFVTLHIKLDPK